MKTAVIDYDAGNLASVVQGLKTVGLEPLITRDPKEIMAAQAVILPGVGAFAQGMRNLEHFGLLTAIGYIAQKGVPFLGICLGMQMLFESSDEHGIHQGLSLLPGRVTRFPSGLKIPHMGWNTLDILQPHPLMKGVPQQGYVYFVHSYYATQYKPEHLVARSDYGVEFPAVVCSNNIMGIQFHPEKSSRIGLQILKNFGEMVKKC